MKRQRFLSNLLRFQSTRFGNESLLEPHDYEQYRLKSYLQFEFFSRILLIQFHSEIQPQRGSLHPFHQTIQSLF